MTCWSRLRGVGAPLVLLLLASGARAEAPALPSPLQMADVLRYAQAHRQEIVAARARVRAAKQRPEIESSLEDPMIMPSVDHLPFMLHGLDASLAVEQRFPLSDVLDRRRRVAEAETKRLDADSQRVTQDVLLDAARAFLMVRERRQMAGVLAEQLELAGQFVGAANARYGAATGNQAEVLRAEIEVARLQGVLRAIGNEIDAAEAMLNASLGRETDAAVPPIEDPATTTEPEAGRSMQRLALRQRPELEVGRAEITRAEAEIAVMKSMDSPMGVVRTGPAYTMADGWGWMLMVGVSVPIWRGKYHAGIREAGAMAEMARADLAAMTRMVEGEVAAARSQVLAARERVVSLRDDVLPRAQQAMEPSVAAYGAGTLPLVSVVDTAQALWSVQAELVSAEFELDLAWAQLYRASGAFGRSDAGEKP